MQIASNAGGENVGNAPPTRQSAILSRRAAGRGARGATCRARGEQRAGRLQGGARTSSGAGREWQGGRMCSYLSNIFDILSPHAILNKNLTCKPRLTMLG